MIGRKTFGADECQWLKSTPGLKVFSPNQITKTVLPIFQSSRFAPQVFYPDHVMADLSIFSGAVLIPGLQRIRLSRLSRQAVL